MIATVLRIAALPFTALAVLFGSVAILLIAAADWNQARRTR